MQAKLAPTKQTSVQKQYCMKRKDIAVIFAAYTFEHCTMSAKVEKTN